MGATEKPFWRITGRFTVRKHCGKLEFLFVILPLKMNPAGVEETGSEDVPGTEQTENKDDEEKLEREKTLLNLKKQKRIRKTEMTKIRHHMEKLYIQIHQ